jgi:hypothetical protein
MARQAWWRASIWSGMTTPAWYRMLARHEFDVDRSLWPFALSIGFWSTFNNLWGGIQRLVYARRLAEYRMPSPPLIILGHWRSGTTMLHELLAEDERYTYPTTWACLAPHHFLRSERYAIRWFNFMIPARRPMDNMALGWRNPQEDEFALVNLGIPSPYWRIAFPNRPPQAPDYVTLEGLSEAELQQWKAALHGFVTQVSYRDARPVVLKSPLHTARVRVIAELFPGAKFVHIVRDPVVVFQSTVNLWRQLFERYGFQQPRNLDLEEYVFATFVQMYERFERDRALIAGNLYELKYEELVNDPVASLDRMYATLGLGDLEPARARMEAYLSRTGPYKTNTYDLDAKLRAAIVDRWGSFMRPYGYCV